MLYAIFYIVKFDAPQTVFKHNRRIM